METRKLQRFHGVEVDTGQGSRHRLFAGNLNFVFGIASPGCVMHFSNSLADTDRKSDAYCRRCAARLR